MDTAGANDETIRIYGRTFRKVDGGLDESEVRLLVEELIADRDKLHKRQEHLSSLTWAFEKVVADADDLANQMKQNAEEQAQSAVKAILAAAEDNARQITEVKKAEAQSEVDALRANAKEEAEALLEQKVGEIQSQSRDFLQRLSNEMLGQAENFKKQVVTFEKELEQQVAALSAVTVDRGSRNSVPPANAETTEATATPDGEVAPETSAAKESAQVRERTPGKNIEWTELEILPPRDKKSIEKIKSRLDAVSGVTSVVILPSPDKTLIEVSTNKPVDLPKILSSIPEVGGVKEVNNGKQKKFNVELSIKSELERDRDSINRIANKLASRIQ